MEPELFAIGDYPFSFCEKAIAFAADAIRSQTGQSGSGAVFNPDRVSLLTTWTSVGQRGVEVIMNNVLPGCGCQAYTVA
jgi:hypothetical protein